MEGWSDASLRNAIPQFVNIGRHSFNVSCVKNPLDSVL